MIQTTDDFRLRQLKASLLLSILMIYANNTFVKATDNTDMDTSIYVVDSSNRWVIACFAFLCALCLSAVTSIIAYCVHTEEQILRNFLLNGVRLEAKVVEYTLINMCRHEYRATIDYRLDRGSNVVTVEGDNTIDEELVNEENKRNEFGTIVRTQIKCVESDFLAISCNENDRETACYDATGNNTEMKRDISPSKRSGRATQQQERKQRSICIEIQKDLCGDDMDEHDVNEKFPSFDVAIFSPPKHYYIDVVVLLEYPTSPIVHQQLMHSMEKIPIIVLMMCLSVMTCFSWYIATTSALPLGRGMGNDVMKSIAALAALTLIEIAIIHIFCHKTINDMLNDEYKIRHNGDPDDDNYYFNYKTEDETLHTMPSSLGGGFTSTSMSWKHSSSNLCSLQPNQSQIPQRQQQQEQLQ